MAQLEIENGMYEKYYVVCTDIGVFRLSSSNYRRLRLDLGAENSLDPIIGQHMLNQFGG